MAGSDRDIRTHDCGGFQYKNAADGSAAQDLVTLSQLAAVEAAMKRSLDLSYTGPLHVLVGNVETVFDEWNAIPGALKNPALVSPLLSALASRTGANGTLRLRVGGTIGAADGTVVVTIVVDQGALSQFRENTAPTFDFGAVDTGSGALVKITAEAGGVADTISYRGAVASFVG